MTTAGTVLQFKDTTIKGALCMSFELSDKAWKLTFGDARRAASHCTVAAGDKAAVLEHIARARKRFGLAADAAVHSCYEAGRDGWWLHRWLHEQGIDNIVVDAASIEVNRRARRAKSDRVDGDKLLAMLMTPTPYDSGNSQREQGISKAGNKRARALLVEQAWMWLRLQPDSALTRWFNERFAHGSSRMRRVGIVALARRLAIALWRFLEHGVIPEGATLKPVA